MGELVERSESDIVCRTLTLTLAGQPVEVEVKSIRANAAFRRKLGEVFACLEQRGENAQADFCRALFERADVVMTIPEVYAPEIREQCRQASDEELLEAGTRIVEVAFPFVRALYRLTETLGRIASGEPLTAT